jgi:hypothetical protein
MGNLYVTLLHEGMCGKDGGTITTSLTLIDLHDIARSCRTFDVKNFFVVHPATAMRGLARTLFEHWDSGYGANYNPDRKEAFSRLKLCTNLDEVIHHIDLAEGKLPLKVATSARAVDNSITFQSLKGRLANKEDSPVLLILGTGHGLGEELLGSCDLCLEPIGSPSEYNHLSVRSACAIMLDRLTRPE